MSQPGRFTSPKGKAGGAVLSPAKRLKGEAAVAQRLRMNKILPPLEKQWAPGHKGVRLTVDKALARVSPRKIASLVNDARRIQGRTDLIRIPDYYRPSQNNPQWLAIQKEFHGYVSTESPMRSRIRMYLGKNSNGKGGPFRMNDDGGKLTTDEAAGKYEPYVASRHGPEGDWHKYQAEQQKRVDEGYEEVRAYYEKKGVEITEQDYEFDKEERWAEYTKARQEDDDAATHADYLAELAQRDAEKDRAGRAEDAAHDKELLLKEDPKEWEYHASAGDRGDKAFWLNRKTKAQTVAKPPVIAAAERTAKAAGGTFKPTLPDWSGDPGGGLSAGEREAMAQRKAVAEQKAKDDAAREKRYTDQEAKEQAAAEAAAEAERARDQRIQDDWDKNHPDPKGGAEGADPGTLAAVDAADGDPSAAADAADGDPSADPAADDSTEVDPRDRWDVGSNEGERPWGEPPEAGTELGFGGAAEASFAKQEQAGVAAGHYKSLHGMNVPKDALFPEAIERIFGDINFVTFREQWRQVHQLDSEAPPQQLLQITQNYLDQYQPDLRIKRLVVKDTGRPKMVLRQLEEIKLLIDGVGFVQKYAGADDDEQKDTATSNAAPNAIIIPLPNGQHYDTNTRRVEGGGRSEQADGGGMSQRMQYGETHQMGTGGMEVIEGEHVSGVDASLHFGGKFDSVHGQRDFIPQLVRSRVSGSGRGERSAKRRRGLDSKPMAAPGARVFESALRHPQNVQFASVTTYIPPRKVKYNFGRMADEPDIEEGYIRL